MFEIAEKKKQAMKCATFYIRENTEKQKRNKKMRWIPKTVFAN